MADEETRDDDPLAPDDDAEEPEDDAEAPDDDAEAPDDDAEESADSKPAADATEAVAYPVPERIESTAGPGSGEGADVDAMGLDKHRAVIGHAYRPSLARQLSRFVIFFVVVGIAAFGLNKLASKLDEPPKSNPDKAPWSAPDSPQTPPIRPM